MSDAEGPFDQFFVYCNQSVWSNRCQSPFHLPWPYMNMLCYAMPCAILTTHTCCAQDSTCQITLTSQSARPRNPLWRWDWTPNADARIARQKHSRLECSAKNEQEQELEQEQEQKLALAMVMVMVMVNEISKSKGQPAIPAVLLARFVILVVWVVCDFFVARIQSGWVLMHPSLTQAKCCLTHIKFNFTGSQSFRVNFHLSFEKPSWYFYTWINLRHIDNKSMRLAFVDCLESLQADR